MAKHKRKFFSVYAVTYWTGEFDQPITFFLKEKKARKHAAKRNEAYPGGYYDVEEYEVHI